MPTVVTEDGFYFRIYPNDHPPAHVHVRRTENEARVILNPIEVMSNEGFTSRELSKIVELVEQHQETLLSAWDVYHESR